MNNTLALQIVISIIIILNQAVCQLVAEKSTGEAELAVVRVVRFVIGSVVGRGNIKCDQWVNLNPGVPYHTRRLLGVLFMCCCYYYYYYFYYYFCISLSCFCVFST